MKTVIEMARQSGFLISGVQEFVFAQSSFHFTEELRAFAELVRADEREAIYNLVMEAPFKEFDGQEEDFDGEAVNAMKAMAFSLTAAIRARKSK